MSLSTLTSNADDFAEWEDEFTQPLGEPLPDPQPSHRPSRATERREAIAESLGIRRHRTHEREA